MCGYIKLMPLQRPFLRAPTHEPPSSLRRPDRLSPDNTSSYAEVRHAGSSRYVSLITARLLVAYTGLPQPRQTASRYLHGIPFSATVLPAIPRETKL